VFLVPAPTTIRLATCQATRWFTPTAAFSGHHQPDCAAPARSTSLSFPSTNKSVHSNSDHGLMTKLRQVSYFARREHSRHPLSDHTYSSPYGRPERGQWGKFSLKFCAYFLLNNTFKQQKTRVIQNFKV